MFATHYHELTALGDSRERACNLHIAVSEWKSEIIFLRTLREGGASKSYGIQCARLAGMPDPVVERARALLDELEKHASSGETRAIDVRQLDLFGLTAAESAPRPPEPAQPEEPEEEEDAPTAPDPIRVLLEQMNPDEMTPRKALDALYELREALVRETVGLD